MQPLLIANNAQRYKTKVLSRCTLRTYGLVLRVAKKHAITVPLFHALNAEYVAHQSRRSIRCSKPRMAIEQAPATNAC